VYAPANEAIRLKEVAVAEGDQVELKNLGVTFTVLDVPGHTEGHVAYLTDGSLFCGDTLFAGGCGRVFSGTFEQLSASLIKLAKLPAETKVYCAHEYTEANLGFAKWVEPNSAALAERQQTVEDKREADQPTVPSVLKDELATNPFMRTQEPVVIAAAEQWAGESLSSPAAVFRALRTWKDKDYD
jgi:hydroxyacylglutathione hydrolase